MKYSLQCQHFISLETLVFLLSENNPHLNFHCPTLTLWKWIFVLGLFALIINTLADEKHRQHDTTLINYFSQTGKKKRNQPLEQGMDGGPGGIYSVVLQEQDQSELP